MNAKARGACQDSGMLDPARLPRTVLAVATIALASAGAVAQANGNAIKAGVADRVQFHERDMFATDVGEATVVTIYLLPSIMGKVEQKLRAELKPGARIVVHGAALMRARHRSARSVR